MRVSRVLFFVVGLLGVMFLSSCTVSPIVFHNQPVQPYVDCVKQVQKWEQYIGNDFSELSAEYYFTLNQLIITAPTDSGLLKQVANEFNLGVVSNMVPITISSNSQSFQIQLFEIRGSKSHSGTVQMACEINTKYASQDVYADPNYILSLAGHGPAVSAEPGWSEFAGNWIAMPNLVLSETLKLTEDDFKNQWSWNIVGSNTTLLTQKEVPIAILDISPSTMPNESSIQLPEEFANKNIYGPRPGRHSVLEALLTSVGETEVSSDEINWMVERTISIHSKFVEGILLSVASNSKIVKRRVVDIWGFGDVYTLLRTIHELRTTQSGSLVINLSLGVHYPRRRCLSSGCQIDNRYALGQLGLPDDIIALEKILKWAHLQGTVIVSAAGNANSSEGDHPLYLTIPSDYEFVIGVASNNKDGSHSCFSHPGDVYAPGGDGVPVGDYKCDAIGDFGSITSDSWKSILDRSIISTMTNEKGEEDYTIWAGTSFSAPFVSGLAALLLEKGLSPQEVHDAIIMCAKQKEGKVNIDYTLTHYQNPDCL